MEIQRLYSTYRNVQGAASLAAGIFLVLGNVGALPAQTVPITGPAFELISQRVAANQESFYVYRDQDSGFNHGFASGFFASPGNLGTIQIDTGCIDSPTSPNGCSTDSLALDTVHGTVMRISFGAQAPGKYAGVNIEEPENWGSLQVGSGYDLRGASNVIFDVRSPNGGTVQFGVGGCKTEFKQIPTTWKTMTVALSSPSCTPDLSGVHTLFAVSTNDYYAAGGATVLLDNIRFDPVPTSHQSALGFPLGSQTFGVVPQQSAPIPQDQAQRNLTTIYESSLTEIALLARGAPQDLLNARIIADTFDYALHHENHGDPLPVAAGGWAGLHNGYESGDIAMFNAQQPPRQGKAGDIRLAGFTAIGLCPASGFCLMLDGATGGNNAFAILALLAAFRQFGDVRYLDDAVTIGNWIVGNLTDNSGTGYEGYFGGYSDADAASPKPLQTGKSTENNADIFAAFSALAAVELQLGNPSAAANWTAAANVAGDFVMQMFDSSKGRFNAGTVQVGSAPAAGICPNGSQKGNDVINTCDFLDSNTFTALAMAEEARYQSQINWRQPIQYVLANFAQTVTEGGHTFQGFDIVPTPVSGANGIAWEFTGQAVEAMRYVDRLYSDTQFETSANFYLAQIVQARTLSPFGDGLGLVASTIEGGDTLPPLQQCLNTPFQCIAERVGLGATAWAILAEQKLNPFIASPPDKATLVSPAGTVASATPTYTWNAVFGSTWYYLWANDSSTNSGKVKAWYTATQAGCSSGSGTCSVTPSTALAAGTSQWWIQTWNDAGYGPWSDVMNFVVIPPPGKATLVSPAGAISSNTPTYTWNAVQSATYYYLWVNDSSTSGKIKIWYTATDAACVSGSGTSCSVTPSTALAAGAAQWWIQTWNPSGYGPWSDGMAFTVGGPGPPGKATLVSPSGTITTATPAYIWNAVPGATWYYLWVNDSTTGSGKIISWYTAEQAGCGSGTGTCSVTPSTALASGNGQWWIQTWNLSGYGPWSDGMSFTISPAHGPRQ